MCGKTIAHVRAIMNNKKAICLLSGGIDSTVTLYNAHNVGYEISALTINYGQLHDVEIKKAQITSRLLGLNHIVLPIKFPWRGSALLDQSIEIPKNTGSIPDDTIPSTYVPARNTIFLSYALSWAEVINAQAIFIGANQIDYSGYPDCRENYLSAMQEAFMLGTKRGAEGKPIIIEAPLLTLNKRKIIELGRKLNVPFENTWSCYRGEENPCLSCDSCYWRSKGFSDAGLEDPLLT